MREKSPIIKAMWQTQAYVFMLLFTLLSLTSLHAAPIPDWAWQARVANLEVYVGIPDQELDSLIAQRKTEKVSVLEVDSGLSDYHTDSQFAAQISLLQTIATKAHAQGLKAVVYIPSLEVNTKNGENLPNSMYKDHPEWIQKGLDGKPGVFYGSQEDWVEPGEESAWLSPNTGYRQYFIDRVKQLAGTGLDGVWLDVPVYRELSNFNWAGAEPAAATAFNQWTKAQGLGGANGYTVPNVINWDNAAFRAWITWRHHNLADFIEDVRQNALSIDPNFLVMTEVFPVDDMDATSTGLDRAWATNKDNYFSVWELDSVSFMQGMKFSSLDEYSNKIAMYKYARGIDRENPSWGFSYGNEVLDASLVMATAVTTGVAPFESKTPGMTRTVSSSLRERWFGFIGQHAQALLKTPRSANVGIWYSSASRDFNDFKVGGAYGMYTEVTSPNNDPDWWASKATESAWTKPHLGGYRGASHALIQLNIPYKVVADPGKPAAELSGVQFLWLPSVAAISDQAADVIKQFVQNGGTVFATGTTPGILDEHGNARSESVFKELFNLADGTPEPRANISYGEGVAVYRPDILGREMFANKIGTELANENLSDIEQIIRIHADDDIIVDDPKGVHIEIGKASNTKHYLYVLNYSGLKQPIVSNPKTLALQYKAPTGYRVANARIYTPDSAGTSGSVAVSKSAESWYTFSATVDQFSLVELTLVTEVASNPEPWPTPVWANQTRREAAESGLDFILNKMRHIDKPEPYTYGVYTNLLNSHGLTEIYAHGHHVSAEHMGLTLRASACMGDQNAWQQSYRYINEAMADPLYNVVNWAMDRDRLAPLVTYEDAWLNANAPLDDFRVIRGLLDGAHAFNTADAETLAASLLTGMYRTSVTDRDYKATPEFAAYPKGLVGYAWNWSATTDSNLTPVANATSRGHLSTDPIPVDYNDLAMIAEAAKRDPRWLAVLDSATDLLLNSEVAAVPGTFYNGYEANGNWTGDFENRDINQGRHNKVIQSLWIALHLARAAKLDDSLLPAAKRQAALQAAQRSLAFFKGFYQQHSRIPEYLSFAGVDVPECTGANIPDGCLIHEEENLFFGEVRIYAQVARLALLLDDPTFAGTVISDKILTDRISDVNDPRYGQIGVSTSSANDAEAWNVLESVFTLCLEATYDGATTGNQAPIATSQNVTTPYNAALNITLAATDTDNNPLSYIITSQPVHGTLSGTAPNLVYTPDNNYSGNDSFTFKANDGALDSNGATVSINVQAEPNQAPVAQDQNLQVLPDLSLSLTLKATDANSADTLTYQVVALPAKGTLSGTAPNLVYTPNAAYTGADSFSFKANDGQVDSNLATVSLSVQANAGQATISNALTTPLQLDGNISEWTSLQNFVADPDDISGANHPIDFLRAWVSHDDEHFYIAYQNDGPIDNTNSYAWGWQVYIDTDSNPATGYLLDSIGAEYVIEGGEFYKYAGTGLDWQWTAQTGLSQWIQGNTSELSVPRSALGNPQAFRLIFVGDNAAFTGGTAVDWYPDGVLDHTANLRYLTYEVSGTPPQPSGISNPVVNDSIVANGDLAEWVNLTSFGQDGADITVANKALDWLEGWFAHDDEHLYIAYRNDGNIQLNKWWAWEIFLDSDSSANTGYQLGFLGADYLLDGNHLWKYTGTGANWSWEYAAMVEGTAVNDRAELKLSRTLLGNPTDIRLGFFGDNGAFTGNYIAAGADFYPNTVTSADELFHYRFQ